MYGLGIAMIVAGLTLVLLSVIAIPLVQYGIDRGYHGGIRR